MSFVTKMSIKKTRGKSSYPNNEISKQRNGLIGTVRLTFIGEHTRFENFAY